MDIKKYGSRNWAVYDDFGNLICVAAYKKGALEVLNRLSGEETGKHSVPSIDLNELTKLQKEFQQLRREYQDKSHRKKADKYSHYLKNKSAVVNFYWKYPEIDEKHPEF